jgi:hypothetical protein
MVLMQNEERGGGLTPTPEGGAQMPKLILAAAALLLDRHRPVRDDGARSALHVSTRSRDATRRLRASRAHEGRLDLPALDLTGRH